MYIGGGGAPQKADVPGIDEARGAPLPRSPYLGRSTPNAADTAHGARERRGREAKSERDRVRRRQIEKGRQGRRWMLG